MFHVTLARRSKVEKRVFDCCLVVSDVMQKHVGARWKFLTKMLLSGIHNMCIHQEIYIYLTHFIQHMCKELYHLLRD